MVPSFVDESLTRDTASAAESLSVMMQKEQAIYTRRDYLGPQPPCGVDDNDIAAKRITPDDRLKIVDWCYSVVDACQFDRETVALTMEMVDRFLSTPGGIVAQEALYNRKKYQLVAMSALYIAIKTNEKVSFGSGYFATMSRGAYSAEQIEAMELAILHGLSWRINAPTSIQMVHHILSLILPHLTGIQESTWEFMFTEVHYQTEHAVRDYYCCLRRPSTIGLAAIFNTVDQVEKQDRQAILQALLSVWKEEGFDSPEDLLAARNRMLSLTSRDSTAEEDSMMSDSSKEVEAMKLRSEGGDFDDEKTASSTRTSPRCVADLAYQT